MDSRVRARLVALVALVAFAGATVLAAGGQRSTADKAPPSLLTSSLAGADNFRSYCAPCHGRDGKGHGPVASALTTPPADVTKLASRNGNLVAEAWMPNSGRNW